MTALQLILAVLYFAGTAAAYFYEERYKRRRDMYWFPIIATIGLLMLGLFAGMSID